MRRRLPIKVRGRLPEEMSQAEIELALFERGWKPSTTGQWQHPNLASCWPAGDAIRLQYEADDGMQDKTHRALRGEEL